MKFRKKTMATLFAAILIAMMGVMPALAADNQAVSITVTTLAADIISITVVSTDPAPVEMTAKLEATHPNLATVTIQSTSTVNIDVTATLTLDPDEFFTYCLMINGAVPAPWPGQVESDVEPDATFVVDLGLDLLTWVGVAEYSGTLVFWAAASTP